MLGRAPCQGRPQELPPGDCQLPGAQHAAPTCLELPGQVGSVPQQRGRRMRKRHGLAAAGAACGAGSGAAGAQPAEQRQTWFHTAGAEEMKNQGSTVPWGEQSQLLRAAWQPALPCTPCISRHKIHPIKRKEGKNHISPPRTPNQSFKSVQHRELFMGSTTGT